VIEEIEADGKGKRYKLQGLVGKPLGLYRSFAFVSTLQVL
jgi:hypothetical protein